MDPEEWADIAFNKENWEPAVEELVNVIINSILCGDIKFKAKDAKEFNIVKPLEKLFNLDDFLRANYLIRKNKKDWDKFITEYPNCKSNEISTFMENKQSLALFIWLLDLRGMLNFDKEGCLFTLVSYEANNENSGQIGIKRFLSKSTFDYVGFVEMWKHLGKPKLMLSRSVVVKDFIAAENNQPVVATKEAIDSVNRSIGHIFLRHGFVMHSAEPDVWNVCDFFSKVSTLIALKRPNPTNHEVYKKPILEVVGSLFPNFEGACALFYLKKCVPVKPEDIKNQLEDVSEVLKGYVNRKRPEPQHEDSTSDVNSKSPKPQQKVKLYHPSVIKLLQENVHYTEIDFPEGTPTNWMVLPPNTRRRRKRGEGCNSQSESQWEINYYEPKVLLPLITGLENYSEDVIKKAADTATKVVEAAAANVAERSSSVHTHKHLAHSFYGNHNGDFPLGGTVSAINIQATGEEAHGDDTGVDNNDNNDSMAMEDALSKDKSDIAPVINNNVSDNHAKAMEDMLPQDEVEIDASVAPVNDDNVLDNQAMEIEDTPSQDEVEIEASIAPLNDYHHDVNHLMDHAVAHDNKEYEYSDASVNDDYHDENHPMGDVVSDDEVKNEDCNALVNDYHETIPEINSERIPAENLYMENGMPDVEMHADSDQNQDEAMEDIQYFVEEEGGFDGFSTSSADDSMPHDNSTINVQNLSDIDTNLTTSVTETITSLASPSVHTSRIVPKSKKHTKKQSSTKKRIENLNKRAPKSMIAKMRGIQASLSTQKSSKKSLKGSLSDKEAHEMGVLAVQAALLAGIAWWYFRLRN